MSAYKDPTYPRQHVRVECSTTSDDEFAAQCARLFVDPVVAATRVICSTEDKAGLAKVLDVPSLVSVLQDLTSRQVDTSQSNIEGALLAQATALQAVFVRLTEIAMQTKDTGHAQNWIRLGLKAQSQSKSSLEALLATRRPAAIYANQANLSSLRQVNNLEINFQQNELSEAENGLPAHDHASILTSETYSQVEAMGQINWPNHSGR
jgi:hypothetical protein